MSKSLSLARYLLAVVPLILTLLDIGGHVYFIYTVLALLTLLLIRLPAAFPRYAGQLAFIELLWCSWLGFEYGGLLFLLIFSTLISAFIMKPGKEAAMLWGIAGAVSLSFMLREQTSVLQISILILWLAAVLLLYAMTRYDNRNEEITQLYEELSVHHVELKAARRRMMDYAKQVEQYAQAEERNRIARDIHDDLGHRLIRVKMMAEAALQLHDSEPARARTMTEGIRDQLQDSMETMRRTVSKLAEPVVGISRKYALDQLVMQARNSLGLSIELRIHGQPAALYPSMEYILYRNGQEAITNAVRHGHADQVLLELTFDEGTVALTVSNNGALPKEHIDEGLGLSGMRERIALIGGSLHWSFEPRFSITTVLPLIEAKMPEQGD